MTQHVTALLATLLLLAAGCGGGNGEGAGTGPAPNGEEPSQGQQTCTNETDGYSVEYPAGWHRNPAEIGAPCTYFHPEPFDVPIGSEFLDVGVLLNRNPVPLEEAASEDDPTRTVIEREEFELNGQRAVRLEAETTAGGLLDPGIRFYQVIVAKDGESIIFSTFDLGGLDFESNKQVIDEMAASLRLLP